MVHSALFVVCTMLIYLLTVAMAAAETKVVLDTQHIRLAAAMGMTTVDDGNVILFVDYKQGVLRKWQRTTGVCESHDISLKSMDADPRFLDRLTLFSDIERLPDGQNDPYPVKLMLAPLPMKTRTVKPPKLVWNGFTIQAEILQFLLGTDQSLFGALKEIAHANSLYNTIPLMHWYDIVSLIPLLGGVPESGRSRTGSFIYSFSLVAYNDQQDRMDALCGK